MEDELFIKNLTKNLEPRSSIASVASAFGLWIVVSCVAIGLQVARHHLRPDIAYMWGRGSFYLEGITAFLVAVICGCVALQLRYPGAIAPMRWIYASVGVWLISLVLHSFSVPMDFAIHLHSEMACFGTVIAFSVIPAALLYFQMRSGASTQPQLTLALGAIASTAAGAAFLTMACPNDGLIHLLLGHASPLLVTGVVCWTLGRRALRW